MAGLSKGRCVTAKPNGWCYNLLKLAALHEKTRMARRLACKQAPTRSVFADRKNTIRWLRHGTSTASCVVLGRRPFVDWIDRLRWRWLGF